MFVTKVLVLFASVSVQLILAFRECPELIPVPIDEKFLLDKHPNGFFATVASGEDKIPDYTPKNVPAAKGAHKACFKADFAVNGKKKVSPPVPCLYDQPSHIMCDPKKAPGAELAAAATGKKLPKVITGSIVDTDNATFLAVGFCVDGAVYQWSFLTTDSNKKELPPTSLKALHVTEEEVKTETSKKMKPGRGTISRGDCLKKIVDTDANVKELQGEVEGLGNLFGTSGK